MRDQYASPVRKGDIYKYACICIFITAILSNCPTLSMDNPSMFRLGSFSRMLCSGSDAEFRQCLLIVLSVHILSAYCRDVYQENSGRCCQNFALDLEQSMGKRTQSTHTWVGLGPIFTY